MRDKSQNSSQYYDGNVDKTFTGEPKQPKQTYDDTEPDGAGAVVAEPVLQVKL